MILGTGGWRWHAEAGLATLTRILAGTFDRHPDLQIILGHWGRDARRLRRPSRPAQGGRHPPRTPHARLHHGQPEPDPLSQTSDPPSDPGRFTRPAASQVRAAPAIDDPKTADIPGPVHRHRGLLARSRRWVSRGGLRTSLHGARHGALHAFCHTAAVAVGELEPSVGAAAGGLGSGKEPRRQRVSPTRLAPRLRRQAVLPTPVPWVDRERITRCRR